MTKVRKTKPEDFTKIVPLLEEFDNTSINRSAWEGIFAYDWNKEQSMVGFHLENQGNVEGFLGGVFSTRLINGKLAHLCNLTSWIVREGFRQHSLALLLEILKIKDHTFTNFTATPETSEISQLLGFSVLDRRFRIILPTFGMLNPFPSSNRGVWVTGSLALIKSQLDGELLRILNDHVGTNLHPLLIKDGDEKCLAFYKIVVRRKKFRASYFLSVSNFPLFAAQINKIMRWIFFRHFALFSIIDERFVAEGGIRSSKSREMPSPMLFKSDNLQPHEIDYLYSECALL